MPRSFTGGADARLRADLRCHVGGSMGPGKGPLQRETRRRAAPGPGNCRVAALRQVGLPSGIPVRSPSQDAGAAGPRKHALDTDLLPHRRQPGLSAAVAAVPLGVVFFCLAIIRMKAHKASVLALAAALGLSILAWGMPAKLALDRRGPGRGVQPLPGLLHRPCDALSLQHHGKQRPV